MDWSSLIRPKRNVDEIDSIKILRILTFLSQNGNLWALASLSLFFVQL